MTLEYTKEPTHLEKHHWGYLKMAIDDLKAVTDTYDVEYSREPTLESVVNDIKVAMAEEE